MKKLLIYNSNTLIGGLATQAARIQNWEITILDKIDYLQKDPEILLSEIKKNISLLIGKELYNTNLTWVTPELMDYKDKETEYFNYIFTPIIISLAFSDLCKSNTHNSITLIGRTFGIDFIEGFSELFNLKGKLDKSVSSTLSTINLSAIVPLTKYLAFKLGDKNITVNSAAFGPIQDIDDQILIKNHNKKSLNLTSFTKDDVIDSLDLFYDHSNHYMTGQVIRYDGGASIC